MSTFAYGASGAIADTQCVVHSSFSNYVGDIDLSSWNVTTGGPDRVLADGDYLYVAEGGKGRELVVYDIQDPTLPTLLASAPLPDASSQVGGLQKVGDYIYVGWNATPGVDELIVFDVSVPASLTQVYTMPAAPTGNGSPMELSGDYLFVGEVGGLRILDVSNAAEPSEHQTIDFGFDSVYGIALLPGFALVTTAAGLGIVDIEPIGNPKLKFIRPIFGNDVAYDGTFAYVVGDTGFHVLDVSNPMNPTVLGSDPDVTGRWVRLEGGEVYVGFPFGKMDVSDPTLPVLSSAAIQPEYREFDAFDVAAGHSYLSRRDGIRVLDTSSFAVAEPYGSIPSSLVRPLDATTIGSLTYVLVHAHDGYGYRAGLATVDFTSPAFPVIVGESSDLANSGYPAAWIASDPNDMGATEVYMDVGVIYVWDVSSPVPVLLDTVNTGGVRVRPAVRGNRLYTGSIVGLGELDITDPSSLALVSYTPLAFPIAGLDEQNGRVYLVEDGGPGFAIVDVSGTPSILFEGSIGVDARAVRVQGDYAYLPDYAGNALWAIDVSTPSAPVAVGSATQPYPVWRPVDMSLHGSVAYVACSLTGIVTFSVGDPGNPAHLGGAFAPGGRERVSCSEGGVLFSFGYSALGWVSPVECSLAPVAAPWAATGARGLFAYPNPFGLQTSIRFQAEGSSMLSVHDVSGRLVRRLHTGSEGSGVQEVVWDRRDESGRRAVPGVYFLRLEDERGVSAQKVVAAPSR